MSALRSYAALSLLVAASLPLGGSLEAGREPVRYDRPLNPFDRQVVERVRTRAAARLEEPECRKVLTDFKDRGGRTLDSNLHPLGLSASRYLLDLPFVDGTPLPACRNLAVMMAVTPGVPRVFVCPNGVGRLNSRLSRVEFQSGSVAEAMVIHEMLHTLGLGENPPTTHEITAQIRERCR